MNNYQGPERRSAVTFTRQDSERLVRVEESVKVIPEIKQLLEQQSGRISKLERKQSWMVGVGATLVFIASIIGYFWKSL